MLLIQVQFKSLRIPELIAPPLKDYAFDSSASILVILIEVEESKSILCNKDSALINVDGIM